MSAIARPDPDLFEPSAVTRVEKPWGHELIFARTLQYVGKILHVKKGQSLSLQYHREKEETLFLLTGHARLTLRSGEDERQVEFRQGQAFHIPPGLIHRIEATTDTDIAEVSTTQLEDVVRLDDRYGRQGTTAP